MDSQSAALDELAALAEEEEETPLARALRVLNSKAAISELAPHPCTFCFGT